jgi:hypothetical protein
MGARRRRAGGGDGGTGPAGGVLDAATTIACSPANPDEGLPMGEMRDKKKIKRKLAIGSSKNYKDIQKSFRACIH